MIASALLLLPDFLLIALGAVLRRFPMFDAPFWRGLERFVYFVLFPALLFRALATSSLAPGDAWRFVVVGVLFTVAGMALSALARPLLRLPEPTFAACFQCAFRFNTYIALAAANRLAGAEGVAAVSLLVGVLVPLVNVAAVAILARERGGSGVWLAIVRNPLVLACAAGLAWNATGIPLPATVATLLQLLAGAALPIGLVAAGAGLEFALAAVFGLSSLERQIAVLFAAVPTAPSAYVLAMQMGGAGAPVALLISSGTLIAIVSLPLWLALVS